MGDPGPGRRGQRFGDLTADAKHLRHLERAFGDACLERLAVEQLHDQVRGLALAAHVEQRAHIGMREPGNRAGLPLEPLSRVARHRHGRRQDLHGNEPIQPVIARLVDLSHAAASQRRQHLVWTEARAGSQAHGHAAL